MGNKIRGLGEEGCGDEWDNWDGWDEKRGSRWKAGNGVQRVQHGVQREKADFWEARFFGKARFAGQPFSMKRILREGRFSEDRFSIKRGEGALRAHKKRDFGGREKNDAA